jgi:hypothetical protein
MNELLLDDRGTKKVQVIMARVARQMFKLMPENNDSNPPIILDVSLSAAKIMSMNYMLYYIS